MKDELEELIDATHDLHGDHSIYEVMDLDRPAAIERIVEMYDPVDIIFTLRRAFTGSFIPTDRPDTLDQPLITKSFDSLDPIRAIVV